MGMDGPGHAQAGPLRHGGSSPCRRPRDAPCRRRPPGPCRHRPRAGHAAAPGPCAAPAALGVGRFRGTQESEQPHEGNELSSPEHGFLERCIEAGEGEGAGVSRIRFTQGIFPRGISLHFGAVAAAAGLGAATPGWGGLRTITTSMMSGAIWPPMMRSTELVLTESLFRIV